jgi:glyoxylase I family protein
LTPEVPQPGPIDALHHISLTVSDLERSVPWYRETLGLGVVGDQQHAEGRTVVLAPSSGAFVILLQEHKAHEGATFSEHRPGLDHLSFRVDDVEALEHWRARFDELGVGHQALRKEDFGAVLIFRDPDRIQLELFVDPRA